MHSLRNALKDNPHREPWRAVVNVKSILFENSSHQSMPWIKKIAFAVKMRVAVGVVDNP
jgi:hypothetical protein